MMKKVNAILIFNPSATHILMCLRTKNPYKGLYNLVGGKVEAGESDFDAAYRELEEETGITKTAVILTHLMDFDYHLDAIELQIYVGKLNKLVDLTEESQSLHWMNVNENFFDMTKFAGKGNIGHVLALVKTSDIWEMLINASV